MIILEIETENRALPLELFDSSELSGDTECQTPGGATLRFCSLSTRRAFGQPETLQLILSFGSGVVSGLVANFLFQKLRGRATRLRIDRTEVQIIRGEIARVLHERIEEDK